MPLAVVVVAIRPLSLARVAAVYPSRAKLGRADRGRRGTHAPADNGAEHDLEPTGPARHAMVASRGRRVPSHLDRLGRLQRGQLDAERRRCVADDDVDAVTSAGRTDPDRDQPAGVPGWLTGGHAGGPGGSAPAAPGLADVDAGRGGDPERADLRRPHPSAHVAAAYLRPGVRRVLQPPGVAIDRAGRL